MALNDGSLPYGMPTQVITIGSVTFVAENNTITEPTQIIERRNYIGEPSGQVFVPDFVNGSSTLQFFSTSTVPPTPGVTYIITRNNASTITVGVSEVGEVHEMLSMRKVNINWRKLYN